MLNCKCGNTVFNTKTVTTAKVRVTLKAGKIVNIAETEDIENRDYISVVECAECKKIYFDIENHTYDVHYKEYRCFCGGTRFKVNQECYHEIIMNCNNTFIREMGVTNLESPHGRYICTTCDAEYVDLCGLEFFYQKGGISMNTKYVLLSSFEREIKTPILYDSLDEARAAMKAALIYAMDGIDDSIFDEYNKDDEYGWEPDGDSAWFNHRHGNKDWRIIEFDEILQQTFEKNNDDEADCSGKFTVE